MDKNKKVIYNFFFNLKNFKRDETIKIYQH